MKVVIVILLVLGVCALIGYLVGYLIGYTIHGLLPLAHKNQDIIINPATRNGNIISVTFPQSVELKANQNYEIVLPKDWATTDNLTVTIREVK